MLVQYRRCLRTLLGIHPRTHNFLVHILAARVPLKTTLAKITRRYYTRVDDIGRENGSGSEAYYTLFKSV